MQGLETVFLIVDYDDDVLQLLSLEAGSLISSANPSVSILNNRFQAVLGQEVSGGGELVRMRFKAIGYTSSSSQIGLSAYFFGDSSGEEIPPDSITSGLVFISGPLISPPDHLMAWPVSSNQIELAWSDRSDNETGFNIERKTKGGSWSLIATVPANVKSYADFSGLKPDTTYFYRVRASSPEGSSAWSNEAQAVTWEAPPSPPTNLTAVALTNNVINLTWQDNSDNETGFKIERKSRGGAYSEIAALPANTRTYADLWVFEPDTTYSYRVRAYNLMGYSAWSNEAEAVTSDIPPDPPTGLIAVASSSSSISLTWQDNSDNETGFKIERKSEGRTYSEIAALRANTKTYSDSGLEPNTPYFYRVRAYNQVGNSAYSNEAANVTWDIPPSPPTDLKTTVVDSVSVDLKWQDNSDNETGFKIEKKKEGKIWFLIGDVGEDIKTYSDLNIEPGAVYYYRVMAYNQFGDSSYSNEAQVATPEMGTVIKVAAPTDVQAGDTFEVSVEVTEIEDLNAVVFTLIFDPLVFEVSGVPRAGELTAPATPMGNLLSPGNYKVFINVPGLDGVDGAGSLAKIELKSIGTSSTTSKLELTDFILSNTLAESIPIDNSLPAQVSVIGAISPPYNLLAKVRSTNLIYLSWQAVSDDKTGFRIERKINSGDYVQIKELPTTVTTYLDPEVSPENTYCYRVRAYNLYAASKPSNQACAAPGDVLPAQPDNLEATALSGTQIRLDWENNSDNELGFKVERRQKGEADYSLVKIIPTANTTTHTDLGLTPKTTYYYRIWAYNLEGGSDYSNTAEATTLNIPPAGPGNLRRSEITSSSIRLSWDDNSDNETGFRIERRTGTADDFDTIAMVRAGTEIHLDSGLTPETTYCYRVFAYNETGDSSYEEACFTTGAIPPISPGNLVAEAVSSSQINLAWQDNSLDEAGFKIERRTGLAGTYTEIATVPARPGTGPVDYQDDGLQEGTTYYYRVRAWNEAGGDSPYSNFAYATTPLPPPPSPLKIAFASGEGYEYDIYLINEDGGNSVALVTSPGIDWEPNISPDGNRLVFSSDRDGDFEIYTIGLDGADLEQITNNEFDDVFPAFSPDENYFKLAFSSDRNGNRDIYLVNGEEKRLTGDLPQDIQPSFRIRIYSQAGQLIKTLTGKGGDIVWEGPENDGGREVSSGIYTQRGHNLRFCIFSITQG
ncbi:MAG: fibronectin type III domain-containing protein, partial [bacterium]|nr:fibronectin type III domain-containing protein [bacterium]